MANPIGNALSVMGEYTLLMAQVFRPVSYTHLDVYKRQSKGNLLKYLTEQGDPIGRSMLTVIKYQDGKLYTAGRFTGCLLYTSRCV